MVQLCLPLPYVTSVACTDHVIVHNTPDLTLLNLCCGYFLEQYTSGIGKSVEVLTSLVVVSSVTCGLNIQCYLWT